MAETRTGETRPRDLLELKGAVECLLLVHGEPLPVERLQEVLGVDRAAVEAALAELQRAYEDHGVQVRSVAGGYQLCTRPEHGEDVQRLLRLEQRDPLSQAALETVAIIAFRQPVTRAGIEALRGVRCGHILERLLERQLIRIVGRRETPGRPLLYGTTERFLQYFGLNDLSDLPPLEIFMQGSPARAQAAPAEARSVDAVGFDGGGPAKMGNGDRQPAGKDEETV